MFTRVAVNVLIEMVAYVYTLCVTLYQIFDGMRPHPIVVSALKMISTVAPSWRVIPATDMIDKVCKDPQFKKEVMKNSFCFTL